MNYQHPELRRQLADDYALGLLRGAARRRFERLLHEDAQLRRVLDASEARLNLLIEVLPPVAPPERLWATIRRRIKPLPARRSLPLAFWRGLALASLLVVAGLATYTVIRPVEPAYVVVMTDNSAQAGWIMRVGDNGLLHIRPLKPQPLPSDRVFQLWVKQSDAAAVQPVGLMSATGPTALPLTGALDKVELFGISVEPPGGSPTGQPTTTPLYQGTPLAL